MSASEIEKRAGSIGAASGLFRSRFLSQSRIATRSSRNAALTNASKNWSRCAGSSLDSPPLLPRPDRCAAFAFPFEKRIGQTKHEKRKSQIC